MDNITKTTQSLEERGLRADSYFTAHLTDGSTHSEHDTNWRDISEEILVERDGKSYTAHLCTLPVAKLRVVHGELETEVAVAEGMRVYQAIVGMASFTDGPHNEIVGRIVGVVQNGKVVEEHFLNGRAGKVEGVKF